MGKGSGSCTSRPALAFGVPVDLGGPASDLKGLLADEELRLFLGDDWVRHAQERQAAELLGDEPASTVSISDPKAAKELQTKLRMMLVRKGPLAPEVKELRAELANQTGEAANPEYAAWHERRTELLGKLSTVAGRQVWEGGSLDAREIAVRESLNIAGEIEVLREERLAQEAALNDNKIQAHSYSKWVSHALFSGNAKSGWHTTPEGRVVFLGHAEQIKHLGVAAKNFVGRKDIEVGYRYWGIDADGRLTAPLSSGTPWAPGINQAEGWKKKKNTTDPAGLYAFKHNPITICAKDYFDIKTGRGGSGRVMITACAMWNSRYAWGEAIKAEFAAPAVFLILPDDSAAWKKKVHKTAEIYHGRVAGPDELYQECLDWVKTELKEF